MCPTSNFMEVYKVDKTFRLYGPENLDPEEVDLNMKWMHTSAADVGSSNRIVARVFIQASETLDVAPLNKRICKDEIRDRMHRCKEYLLVCDARCQLVTHEVEQVIQARKNGLPDGSTEFPQVSKLEESCASFLSSAKQTVQTLAEMFNAFYSTDFNGPRFDRIIKWAEVRLSHIPSFVDFLQQINPDLKQIVDLRNAQEHPHAGRELIIKNFVLIPGERIALPHWYITNGQRTTIHRDMADIIDFLVIVSETVFLKSLMDNIDDPFPYAIRTVDDSEIDPACPIKYIVEPDISFCQAQPSTDFSGTPASKPISDSELPSV